MRHEKFIKFMGNDLSKNVLEIGSRGNLTKNLKNHNFITVDISDKSLRSVTNLKIKASSTALPFKDSTFEIVIFSEIIEHMGG